jgi:quercetin dioxygenase-like cupin family protein
MNKVVELENYIKDLPQVEIPIEHHFAPGVYARVIHIPAGVVLTGKIHKTLHMCILAQGTVHITVDNGEQSEVYEGFCIFNAPAGSKKAIYAETDAVFINVHPTDSTDLEEIEEEFIAPSYEALERDEREKLEETPQ